MNGKRIAWCAIETLRTSKYMNTMAMPSRLYTTLPLKVNNALPNSPLCRGAVTTIPCHAAARVELNRISRV